MIRITIIVLIILNGSTKPCSTAAIIHIIGSIAGVREILSFDQLTACIIDTHRQST